MSLYHIEQHASAWSYQPDALDHVTGSADTQNGFLNSEIETAGGLTSLHDEQQDSFRNGESTTALGQSDQSGVLPTSDLSASTSLAQAAPVAHVQAEAVPRKNSANPVRRRTSRACDQCNQLRTKCDGRHPCGHCTEIGQKCEYARLRKKRGKASKKDLAGRAASGKHGNHVPAADPDTNLQQATIEDTVQHPRVQETETSARQQDKGSVGDFQSPAIAQISAQSRGDASRVTDSRSNDSPKSTNNSAASETGGSVPSAHVGTVGGNSNPMAMSFQDIIMDGFGNTHPGGTERLNSMNLSQMYQVNIGGLHDENFILDPFTYQRDSPLGPLLEGSVGGLSPENFAGIAPQPASGMSTIRYPVLIPVLPYIKNILPNSLACELLEYYFTSSSSAHPHPVSPYLPGFVFSKRSFLTPVRPRKCSPALLASMLWIAARTSDARPLTSPPAMRGRVCQKLLNLAVNLLQPLIHGSAAGKSVSEYPGRLIINGSALGGDGVTLDNLTADKIAPGTVDDVATYMHLAIVVSASEDKAASIRWWNVAWCLVKELKLGQEVPYNSDSTSGSLDQHEKLFNDGDDHLGFETAPIPLTEEEREERRRLWWILYIVDRHLALCYNRPLILLEKDCEGLQRPMDERAWQSGNFPTQHTGTQMRPSRFEFTGPSVFGWFLPLMTILGEIVDLHHARQHPLLRCLSRGIQYWDSQIQGLIVEQLESFERSMNSYAAQHLPASQTPFHENATTARPSQTMTELQIHTKIAIAYSTDIMHVLHILSTGKLDPISLLDDEDLWISSPSFVTAIGHAVNGAQVVTDILMYDPDLSFIPFFYGIYLLQGSFLLLLVADKLQGDANPSVVRACETMVRAHEACVVTLNTEYQKAFRKVMQSALAQVRGRVPEDAGEKHRRRRETLALYRWTGDGTGLAI